MNLRHEFDVPASPQATLELLLDAGRVVSCMPGATLVEVSDDGTWKTAMAVKLGPVGMDFLNDVRIVEEDSQAGSVRLEVSGRDKRGKGGAQASVDARLTAVDGGTRVSMAADVKFSGQAAQLGRPSVIQDISTRLVDQFAQCIRDKLADSPAPRAPEGQPVSAVSLLWAAARGALARLIRFRPGLRQKGSL
jgi:carbon monoxide dehydrogenase subunit G